MLAAQAISSSSLVNVRPRADSYEAMKMRELSTGTNEGTSALAKAPEAAPTMAASGSETRLSQS